MEFPKTADTITIICDTRCNRVRSPITVRISGPAGPDISNEVRNTERRKGRRGPGGAASPVLTGPAQWEGSHAELPEYGLAAIPT